MKMTLRELIEVRQSLDKILNAALDFKLAYRLKKISRKILDEQKHVEDARQEMFKKFGRVTKNGNYEIVPEKTQEFKDEWDKFLAMDVELDFQKVPFSCIKSISLSGYDIAHLEMFIEEPTEEELKIETPKP